LLQQLLITLAKIKLKMIEDALANKSKECSEGGEGEVEERKVEGESGGERQAGGRTTGVVAVGAKSGREAGGPSGSNFSRALSTESKLRERPSPRRAA
jgi:hypothetical protein